MQKNQRARLVLHPIGLVLLLVAIGLATGLVVFLRLRAPAASIAASPSGSDIVLSSDRLDFGDFTLARSVARQLLVRNSGRVPVRLRIEDASGSFFVTPARLDVDPGKTGRVTITTNARQLGSFRHELRIVPESGAGTPLLVLLEGTAREGSPASASPESVASGAAPAASSQDLARAREPGGPCENDLVGVACGGDSASAPPGSVRLERSTPSGVDGSPGSALRGGPDAAPRPGAGFVTDLPSVAARSIAERPTPTTPREGEQPTPVDSNRKKPADLEPKQKAPAAFPLLEVSAESTIMALGRRERLSPQQIAILGSAAGGPFTLASALLLPRIPIGFGQSLQFGQKGAAVGGFDLSSGQVTTTLPLEVLDPNNNAAPLVLQLTTGTVTARNNNGVLVSLVGEPRAPGSGVLHLVGMGQVPSNYRNSAEQQFVFLEIWATLSFPSSSAGSTGGAN